MDGPLCSRQIFRKPRKPMTKKLHASQPTPSANLAWHIVRQWRRFLPLGMTFTLPSLLRAENQVDYRFGYYDEVGKRVKVETQSVYFEQKLIDSIIAKGELVYDGISGATPNGTHHWSLPANATGPDIVNTRGKANTTAVWDIRRAVNLELDCKLGNQTLTPGFAWSSEHDYLSYGISLNDAIEFNDKNTILQLGVSHNFDSVRHFPDESIWSSKQSTEGIIGISQLLSPKDILNVAFTFGNDSGYLIDPYRSAEYLFTNPNPNIFGGHNSTGRAIPGGETRPSHRNKEILFTSETHHFDSLNASLEGSYRFYHDSYDVFSHTVGLTWHQWLGKHLMVEPLVRFNYQTAASFYSPLFSSDIPIFHSSDYRLSELYTTDVGLQATVFINDHFRFIAGYHRYEMNGLDGGKTSSDMYPKANVYSVGISILW